MAEGASARPALADPVDYSRYQELAMSQDGPVLTITMNRPQALNAFTYRMHSEFAHIWYEIARDDSVSVVIVTGAGRAFCAGNDLKQPDPTQEQIHTIAAEARAINRGMIELDKPIIAAINGVAVGGGAQIALMSDITVMARDGVLLDGHVRVGVAAGDHACLVWPLLCGMAKAKYYLFTNDRLTGEEAERIGLVSLAVDAEDVYPRALEIARALAKTSQFGLRGTKRALNDWLRQAWPIFEHSLAEEIVGFFHPDVTEARQAFRDKREPDFPSARAGE